MTKFNLVSDMHLNFADIELPGGDVLIMAGDIVEAGHIRLARNAKKDTFLLDRYARFFAEEMPKYKKVIYVFGNHEHYRHVYHDSADRIRSLLPDNVQILEQETCEVDDVLVFGATLWTNFNRGDPITLWTAKQNMNDFKDIHFKSGLPQFSLQGSRYYTSKFTPEYAKSVHHETLEKLKKVCENNPDRKILVVTHHAPTEMSIDPAYKQDYHMNGSYASRLEDFILDHPNIKYWVHGHVHYKNDYMVGDCRVLSNPRGYYGYEMLSSVFNPGFNFEL